MQQVFDGVFGFENKLWTKNRVPGVRVYDEKLQTIEGTEYRQWNPYKSKLAAAIQNGLRELPIRPKTNVLYLGSAEGTTVSHLSDILLETDVIIGIDSSARVMPKFLKVVEQRQNIVPILADANKPEQYASEIRDIRFDVLYQDIAQQNQAEIFVKNSVFLKPKGHGLLVIKAASVDSSASPKQVFDAQTKQLKPTFDLIQTVSLDPFQTAHILVHCQKK